MSNQTVSGALTTVSEFPTMRHILDNLCDMNEDEARRAYAALGVHFDKEGELLLSKTVFSVARLISRERVETPQIARENPIVAATWRGDTVFTAALIESVLFHFDVEVDRAKIQGVLNVLARKGIVKRFSHGVFQMVTS